MSIYFLDSNAVAKYYVTELGSHWIRRVIDNSSNTCLITMIVLPELAAALSRMQRLSRFGKSFMNNAFARFRSDLRQRLFYHHPLDEQTLFLASDLALRHPLKGYDAVQVASALLAQQQLERAEVTFVSSDQQVLRVAEAEGLATDDPEQHSEGSQ